MASRDVIPCALKAPVQISSKVNCFWANIEIEAKSKTKTVVILFFIIELMIKAPILRKKTETITYFFVKYIF